MNAMTAALFATSVALALFYGAIWLPRSLGPVRATLKTVPVALLTVLALYSGQPLMLAVALGLSAVGDWLLAHEGERPFLGGLAAFLLAHLAYCVLFAAGQDPEWSASAPFLAGAVLVLGLAFSVFSRLRPHLGNMRLPVAIYAGAIAAMAITALSRGPDPLLLGGVALFLASDIVLASERFVLTGDSPWRRWSAPFIWHAYYAGQALIAASFVFR